VFTPVEDPAGPEGTGPSGISNLGVIVGSYIDSSGIIHGFERSPARWTSAAPVRRRSVGAADGPDHE